MNPMHAIVRQSLKNVLLCSSRRRRNLDRLRLLQHEQLEQRCLLTLPATLTFAEGDTVVYNGPTVDTVNDTLSFDAFIDFAGDIDSYFFAPQFSGSYTIAVGDIGNTVDPEVAIYNASTGAQVGYNDDLSAFNDDAQLVLNLTADVRYIIAVGDNPGTTAGNVSITVTAPFRTASFLLTPDPFGDATASVLLDVPTDIDYYSITAPADATGVLSISTTGSTFNQRLALFDSAGALLQGPLVSINFSSVNPNQEYRIAVFPSNYSSSGSLDLKINFANSGAVVSNTLDAGPGSLRQAILDANAHPNDVGVPDKIRFAIPGAGPYTISLTSALPDITEAVEIDGGTQPGTGATPTITIDGSTVPGTADGLKITADGTIIRKMNISRFSSDGIQIQANSVSVENSTIGTSPNGLAALGNSQYGIRIVSGSNNQINSNVLSGNAQGGVAIIGDTADSNVLDSNTIGAQFGGSAPLPNGYGVAVSDGDLNIMSNNVISGNNLAGISVSGNATGNSVIGNKIGTTLSGDAALPNGGDGISLQASGNQVGGNQVALRNVISGNARSGITISGAAASNNVIEGNVIGTNLIGQAAIPNTEQGVRVISAAGNRIGSATDAAARNIISGNGGSGVTFSLAGVSGSLVAGNYIGVAANGTSALGNSANGILLTAGATDVQIGGTGLSQNVISANQSNGISLLTGANNNRISGNRIGTTPAGAPLGNVGSGVFIQSSGNTIGGINGTFQNIIAGNAQGITLTGTTAANNTIKFNTIGTDAASNSGRGIQFVSGASSNTVGPGNNIRRNETGLIVNQTSTRNKITRNFFGQNTNLGIDLVPGAGATANDSGDADSGGNQLQNWPAITSSLVLTAAELEIEFNVPSSPTNSAYPLTIEFFLSDGAGEGSKLLGSTIYTAANFASGGKTINFAGAGTGLTAGSSKIVGTATDLNGNTSEFSTQSTISSVDSLAPAFVQKAASTPQVGNEAVASRGVVLPLSPVRTVGKEISGNGLLLIAGATSQQNKTSRSSDAVRLGLLPIVPGLRKETPAASLVVSARPLDDEAFWNAILKDLDTADLIAGMPSLL